MKCPSIKKKRLPLNGLKSRMTENCASHKRKSRLSKKKLIRKKADFIKKGRVNFFWEKSCWPQSFKLRISSREWPKVEQPYLVKLLVVDYTKATQTYSRNHFLCIYPRSKTLQKHDLGYKSSTSRFRRTHIRDFVAHSNTCTDTTRSSLHDMDCRFILFCVMACLGCFKVSTKKSHSAFQNVRVNKKCPIEPENFWVNKKMSDWTKICPSKQKMSDW
jgi:hypothetical protein